MKHIKLFESQYSAKSIRTIATEFNELLDFIKPAIIEKFNILSEDPDYEPSYGDNPNDFDGIEDLVLEQIGYDNTELQFVLRHYDDDGNIHSAFYIDVTDNELQEMITKLEGKKYNL